MNKQSFQQKSLVFVIILAMATSIFNLYGQENQNRKIKVALIYTGTSPELVESVERELKEQLGAHVELMNYAVPSVLEEILKTGYVTVAPAAKMVRTYMEAVEAGADAILSICSSVGDVAHSVQDLAKYLGVPIVMVNEEMCREAVRKGNKIAVMATLPTSIDPTRNILLRVSREMGKHIEVITVLVDGAYGLDRKQFEARMAEEAEKVAGQVDVIVFAQGSMAYCEKLIADRFQKTVLSNPYFGAKALKAALIDKGLIVKPE
jgi:Asp/Glu/hydantoin racemase